MINPIGLNAMVALRIACALDNAVVAIALRACHSAISLVRAIEIAAMVL